MSKELISRVVMLPDGSVHIALQDHHTVVCTPASLTELITDPYAFIGSGQFNFKDTTKIVNSSRSDLEYVKGLTLLRVFSDAEIVCVFPKLFTGLFESIGSSPNEPLNLSKIALSLDLSDEKHFLLKFFYEFTNEPRLTVNVRRKIGVEESVRNAIISETLNSIFMVVAPEPEEEHQNTAQTENEETLFSESKQPEVFISVAEFAALHGVNDSTVRAWIKKDLLRGFKKVNERYWINAKSPRPEDRRKGRPMPPKSTQGIDAYFSDKEKKDLYGIVQDYIRDREIVSPEIAPFIRTSKELEYYISEKYHEVKWHVKNALIIDIKPDYFSEDAQMSNRELIRKGKSPRVPGKDNVEYHLHHIGQSPDSPFAIIPGDVHLGQFKLFHPNICAGIRPENEENLHDKNYEITKVAFWKEYLRAYDVTGFYKDIESSSLWVKRGRKKNGKEKTK